MELELFSQRAEKKMILIVLSHLARMRQAIDIDFVVHRTPRSVEFFHGVASSRR
jgi:hypothetical protein